VLLEIDALEIGKATKRTNTETYVKDAETVDSAKL
jgi:hypothetical protein